MAPLRYAAKFDPFLSLDYGVIQFCHLATLSQGEHVQQGHALRNLQPG